MILSEQEARVLGCLIEKSQATPDYYPMTLNSLVAACNQKTSRDPVVNYSETEVDEALRRLRDKGLCTHVTGDGRSIKFRHRCGDGGLELTEAQMAVLSLLLLRGSQTAGELKARAGRQFDFPSLEAVQQTLESLMAGEFNYLEQAARRPGQKETRYRHLLFAYSDDTAMINDESNERSLREEVEALKRQVTALEGQNERLALQLEILTGKIKHLEQELS